MRVLLLLLLLAQSIQAKDLSYLLNFSEQDIQNITPHQMLNRALYIQRNLERFHQINGLIFKAYYNGQTDRNPSSYGTGGDTAIFTGHYLAAAVFRYQVTQTETDLDQILEAIRGLHLVTHVSGVPGVVARFAYPLNWTSSQTVPDQEGAEYSYKSPSNVADPNGGFYPPMRFRTRATRDQLSGILFGLSAAWVHLPWSNHPKIIKARKIIRQISLALYFRLESTDYELRDQLGESGTNADEVDGFLKALVIGLSYRILFDQNRSGDKRLRDLLWEQYVDERESALRWSFVNDSVNGFTNRFQYFAWNLRFIRTWSLFWIEVNYKARGEIFERMRDKLWFASIVGMRHSVRTHQNAHFALLYFDVLQEVFRHRKTKYHELGLSSKNENDNPSKQYHRLNQGIWSLKSLSLRPLRSWNSPWAGQDHDGELIPPHLREPTGHFVWQKDPFGQVGKLISNDGALEATGVDFLLPYWMGRARFKEFDPFTLK